MGDIINLRIAKKTKARAAHAQNADQNRLKFGRTLAEKNLTKSLEAKAAKALDGHSLTKPNK